MTDLEAAAKIRSVLSEMGAAKQLYVLSLVMRDLSEANPVSAPVAPPKTERARARRPAVGTAQDVFSFVRKCLRLRGRSPTYKEIAAAVGASPITVGKHIAALEKDGLIRRSGKTLGLRIEIVREATAAELPDEQEQEDV